MLRAYYRAIDRKRYQQKIASGEKLSPFEIFERDDWTCQVCGLWVDRDASVPAPLSPTLDHRIPLSKGGLHTPGNVQLAHFHCNSIKGNKT
jgi:5-methylcytosine-specific restriction endonuclease McrA